MSTRTVVPLPGRDDHVDVHAARTVREAVGGGDARAAAMAATSSWLREEVVATSHGRQVRRVLRVSPEGVGGTTVDDQAEHGHDADEGEGEDDQRLAALTSTGGRPR